MLLCQKIKRQFSQNSFGHEVVQFQNVLAGSVARNTAFLLSKDQN